MGKEWNVCDEDSRYCGAEGNAVDKLEPPAVDEKESGGADDCDVKDRGPGGLLSKDSVGDQAIAPWCGDSGCAEADSAGCGSTVPDAAETAR